MGGLHRCGRHLLARGFDFDDSFGEVLETYGLADCTVNLAAEGTIDVTDATRSTFEGTWQITDHDCGTTGLETAIES